MVQFRRLALSILFITAVVLSACSAQTAAEAAIPAAAGTGQVDCTTVGETGEIANARLYIEYNATDGDLGVHGGVDDDGSDASEGPDVPITGAALEKASAAALAYIGAGRVTEPEVGDEEGYYEVEITLDDGRQVDVHLDAAFNVLGHEAD